MTPSTHTIDEAELTFRLRQIAAEGGSVSDLIAQIRGSFPGPDIVFAVVLHLRRAFYLTVGEARLIEGSALLGRTLYDVEQTEALIRPLIEQNRPSWETESGISGNNRGRVPNY
jgi:hypothetical protein